MDIFMLRQDRQGKITDNVVVELKRPNIRLGAKEVDQIKKYMRVIKSDNRFNAGNVKWTYDRVTDIVAIIEIKYGDTVDYGRTDIPKMYAKSLDYDCQYYFAFIDERSEYLSLPLLDGRSRSYCAKGCFTELNAG